MRKLSALQLGAVEMIATGNNLLAGAGSEAAADFIVQTLYDGKSTKELSESEKQTVTFLSQLAGGLASGIIGDSTQSAAVGVDIGKLAVENNHFVLDYSPEYVNSLALLQMGNNVKNEIEKKVNEEVAREINEDPYGVVVSVAGEAYPDYVSGWFGIYKFGARGTINLRTFDVFLGESLPALNDFSVPRLGGGIEFGKVINFTNEDKKDRGRAINGVLNGSSFGGSACYGIYCGSATTTLSGTGKNYQTIGVGLGSGYSLGFDNLHKVSGDKNE